MDFFRVCGMEQHVKQPTHNGNVLDLILSTSHNILDVSVLPPLATSDHNPPCDFPRPDFLNTDFTALNNYFLSIDWWALLDQYSSMDDIYQRFCRVVYNGLAHTCSLRESVLCLEPSSEEVPHYERRLGSQASLRRLFHYFRQKLKPNHLLPTLADQTVYSRPNFSHEWDLSHFPHVADSLTDFFFDPGAASTFLKKLRLSTSEPYDGIPQI
ncbi:hypothetical protein COOONC_01737, partial [Cooperia oncophora]